MEESLSKISSFGGKTGAGSSAPCTDDFDAKKIVKNVSFLFGISYNLFIFNNWWDMGYFVIFH